MGKITRNIAAPLMTACEVAKYLLDSCKSLREFDSFMFGSSLIGVGNDFDILIVGPCDESLSRLKTELGIAAHELPLDVLYMLPAEAEVTEFVAREGCVTLGQLATSLRTQAHAKPRLDA